MWAAVDALVNADAAITCDASFLEYVERYVDVSSAAYEPGDTGITVWNGVVDALVCKVASKFDNSADVVISQPFWPAYITAERFALAPNLKLCMTAGIGSDHVDLVRVVPTIKLTQKTQSILPQQD